MKKRWLWLGGLLVLLSLALASCGTPTPERIEVEVPGPERTVVVEVPVTPAPIDRTVIEFWSTDDEEDRVDLYEEIADRFMAEHPEVDLRILPIKEGGISLQLAAAQSANRLPDIVRMGVERMTAFNADGLLDQDAAEAVIASIGEDDFRAGPLGMVTDPDTGKRAAVPFDGWIQAIWYRADVFEAAGLAPPTTWDAIDAACDALPGTGNLLYAVTIGTDTSWNYGHQVFEQVAMSNNAWPFDLAGNVTMNTPEMIEALEFNSGLQRCATPGSQYWRGAREAYELDQSGMLFYSTYIMDDLVEGSGLEAGGKVDIPVEDLALKTGFASEMEGPAGSASYGQLVTFSILEGADPLAQDVVEFFMTGENYVDVLSLAPFGKVPVLKSAVEGWSTLSPFFEFYSEETMAQIAGGFDTMQRWLFRPGYDSTQQAVIGDIEGRLLIPTVLSNIALEGTMTPETAAAFLQTEVEKLLADRLEG